MATRRTKEEKLKLIADYEASGLFKEEWCYSNGISKSTFAVWLRSTKFDVTKHKKSKVCRGYNSGRITDLAGIVSKEYC